MRSAKRQGVVKKIGRQREIVQFHGQLSHVVDHDDVGVVDMRHLGEVREGLGEFLLSLANIGQILQHGAVKCFHAIVLRVICE